MISLLVSILVALLIMGVVYWFVTLLPLPDPFKKIGLAICVLIFLIIVLNIVGLIGEPWRAPR